MTISDVMKIERNLLYILVRDILKKKYEIAVFAEGRQIYKGLSDKEIYKAVFAYPSPALCLYLHGIWVGRIELETGKSGFDMVIGWSSTSAVGLVMMNYHIREQKFRRMYQKEEILDA